MNIDFERMGRKAGTGVGRAAERSMRFFFEGLFWNFDASGRALGAAFGAILDMADACGRVLFDVLWFVSRLGMRRKISVPLGALSRMLEDDMEGKGPCAWRMVGTDASGSGFVVAARTRKGAVALAERHGGAVLE